jgi:hypothetical protein
MRVNATVAASLVGISDKAIGTWLRKHGGAWGAQKVQNFGRPEEWEIDLDQLYLAMEGNINPERIRAMRAWLDLHERSEGKRGSNPAG